MTNEIIKNKLQSECEFNYDCDNCRYNGNCVSEEEIDATGATGAPFEEEF